LVGIVPDGRRSTERRGAHARLEIIARCDVAKGHIEMGVGVDAAGDDVHVRGVNHPGVGAGSNPTPTWLARPPSINTSA